MGKGLLPDFFFNDIYKIDKEFLYNNNIKGLLLDIDNTLISNTVHDADEKLKTWIYEKKADGIKLCIVSNGKGPRVERFNIFGIPAVHKAKKPFKKGFLKGIEMLKLQNDEVAVVGDQIFTDVWGGNRAKIKTI